MAAYIGRGVLGWVSHEPTCNGVKGPVLPDGVWYRASRAGSAEVRLTVKDGKYTAHFRPLTYWGERLLATPYEVSVHWDYFAHSVDGWE